jgi:hypothetical protein
MMVIIIFLSVIILILWFMLCWLADISGNLLEALRESVPYVPDSEGTEEERAELIALLDKVIPKFHRLGAWTRSMQGPMIRLHEKLERHGL